MLRRGHQQKERYSSTSPPKIDVAETFRRGIRLTKLLELETRLSEKLEKILQGSVIFSHDVAHPSYLARTTFEIPIHRPSSSGR